MLGFPAGYTDSEKRTQRLRMLGNAVQVQCGLVLGQMIAYGEREPTPAESDHRLDRLSASLPGEGTSRVGVDSRSPY